MAWVRFGRKFNWRVPGVKGVSYIAYPPGEFSVKRACADAAVAAGAGELIRAPSRKALADAVKDEATGGAGA